MEEKTIQTVSSPVDCMSCRLIGGTSLLGASAYVFFRGMKGKLMYTRVITAVFGTSLGYVGVARLLNIYPFNSLKPKNT